MRHEMTLDKTHSSGAEEWHCPLCGRRFLMHLKQQKLDLLILEAGDESASHFGGKGGLWISAVEEEPVLSEELRAAFDDIDFGD